MQAAVGFDRAGADYERGRPGYPDEALETMARELGIDRGRVVVDLAAGTGKLTRALTRFGARLIAVEPVRGMRAQLVAVVPGVEALDGTAEQIPLGDASVDAVVVAQAFHWFDASRAALEPSERQTVLRRVRAVIASDSESRGGDELEMPYGTHLAWCHTSA